MSEDINELHKEWRAIVLSKLNNLEANQNDIRQDIADVKTSFAQEADLKSLHKEVDKLKEFKSKTIGIIVAANFIIGLIMWYFQNAIHK